MTIWKNITIEGKESIYEINSDGEIRNKHSKHILAQIINNSGLLKCDVTVGDKKHSLYIHKLLAEYFVPNPNNLERAYHIDGDKTNNALSNIGWTSQSEAVSRGNATKKRVKQINQYSDAKKMNLIATFDSVLDASDKLGIHRTTITKFLTGKRESDKIFLSYAN